MHLHLQGPEINNEVAEEAERFASCRVLLKDRKYTFWGLAQACYIHNKNVLHSTLSRIKSKSNAGCLDLKCGYYKQHFLTWICKVQVHSVMKRDPRDGSKHSFWTSFLGQIHQTVQHPLSTHSQTNTQRQPCMSAPGELFWHKGTVFWVLNICWNHRAGLHHKVKFCEWV